jgi:Uma2 family endonuclease
MSIITYPSGVVAPLPPLPVRRFTVAEYHHLLATGVLKSGDPYELLEGWIVQKMSRNSPHDVALDKTEDAIRAALPAGWRVRGQKAITLQDSEPEPDIAVVLGPPDRYTPSHPTPADIAMLVEAADTSLHHDRTTKGRIYARAGIPVYWIINVVDRQVEVYTDPTGDVPTPEYRQRQDFPSDSSVPLVIGGQSIASLAVTDLLPKQPLATDAGPG